MALKLDTPTILYQSLEELLQKKEFAQISVSEIIQNCGASRSVFYKYFHDKYDLALWAWEQFIRSIVECMKNSSDPIGNYTLQALSYIYSKRDFYKKLVKYKGQNSFSEIFLPMFIKSTSEYAKVALGVDTLSENVTFSIKFNGAAHAFIIQEWLESGCPESPEHLASLLNEYSSYANSKIQNGSSNSQSRPNK